MSINGVQPNSVRAVLANNGYLIKNENLLTTVPESYSDAVNVISNKVIDIAPYVAYAAAAPGSAFVLFDKTNQQFVSNVSFSFVATPVTTTASLFPWNQTATGRQLVYMENTMDKTSITTANIGNSFAVMKDPQQAYHLYKFYARTRLQVGYFAINAAMATDFDKADRYAFYSNRSYMFYTVGSKLYAYDFSAGHEKLKLIRDFGADQITMIKFDIQNSATLFNDLYVATYNAAAGGTLRKITVQDDPNDILTTETKSWSGLNKIVSIDWRND